MSAKLLGDGSRQRSLLGALWSAELIQPGTRGRKRDWRRLGNCLLKLWLYLHLRWYSVAMSATNRRLVAEARADGDLVASLGTATAENSRARLGLHPG